MQKRDEIEIFQNAVPTLRYGSKALIMKKNSTNPDGGEEVSQSKQGMCKAELYRKQRYSTRTRNILTR